MTAGVVVVPGAGRGRLTTDRGGARDAQTITTSRVSDTHAGIVVSRWQSIMKAHRQWREVWAAVERYGREVLGVVEGRHRTCDCMIAGVAGLKTAMSFAIVRPERVLGLKVLLVVGRLVNAILIVEGPQRRLKGINVAGLRWLVRGTLRLVALQIVDS